MRRLIKYFFLRMEYSFHKVDAYLYGLQGDVVRAADSESRAYEAERMMVWLGLQP